MDWLEKTAPGDVSAGAGGGATGARARIADAMDELDSVLLTAIAESEEGSAAPMDRARAEAEMRELWARTFTAVARAQEDWLESAFIRRGAGIVEHLYPDADERLRLYHYGFTPVIRSEEHTYELQSLMRISYAVF